LIDPPPGGTASVAEASRFPRLARPSRAAIVACAGVAAVLVVAYMVGEALAIFIVGLILVYLLDWPVSWLARHGVPRASQLTGQSRR